IIIAPDNSGFYARDNAGRSIRFADFRSSREVIASNTKINAISLSPDGRFLAGAGENGSLFLWDISQNYAVTEIPNISNPLTSIAFDHTGRLIVVGDNRGLVKIYDNTARMIVRILSGHSSGIEQIRFNHAGSFMATASKDKTVRLWNISNLKEQPIILSD